MKTEQITITFPKKDLKYKKILQQMKEEESLNVSSFVVSCVKKEIGIL